jgi:hypothetical protein
MKRPAGTIGRAAPSEVIKKPLPLASGQEM